MSNKYRETCLLPASTPVCYNSPDYMGVSTMRKEAKARIKINLV
jgi:hypothetical protein